MKMLYGAPSGARVKKGFWGIQVRGDFWWDYTLKKWVPLEKVVGRASNTCECRSEKAFISHLRRHPEIFGEEVILIHRCYPEGEDYEYWITVDWELDNKRMED